jgi:hypothetical protein
MFDQRVSLVREQALRACFAAAGDGRFEGRLQKAIREYHDERVRMAPLPEFLDSGANSRNLPSERCDMTDLARILNLNGLAGVISAARGQVGSFHDFPLQPGRSGSTVSTYDLEVLKWLDSRLTGSGSDPDTLIRDLLLALNNSRTRKPYHPTWATTWRDFESVIAEGAERWCEVVSVPNAGRTARWVLVLRYRLPPGLPLVRPTILDAGFNAYHFPSPPDFAREAGHPMDLRLTPAPQELRPEYIHCQIDHIMEHWEAGGRLLSRAEGPPAGRLGLRRRAHLRLLANSYGSSILGWMGRYL